MCFPDPYQTASRSPLTVVAGGPLEVALPQCDDSISLSPEQRLHEIARLLAAGVLRLRAHRAWALGRAEHSSAENLPETAPDRLELLTKTMLDVQDD